MRFSLRTKIVWVSVIFVLIGGIVAAFSVFTYTKNILVQEKKEAVERNNAERSKETELVMSLAEKAVASISKNESVVDFLAFSYASVEIDESKELGDVTQEVAETEVSEKDEAVQEDFYTAEEIEREFLEINIGNIFDILYLTDLSGKVLVSTDSTLLGNDYSFRDYFREALKEGSFVDFSVGVTTGKSGYYFSKSVEKGGEKIGVIVGKMGSEFVNATIENNTSFYDSNSMLVDRFGVIIFSNKPERLYKSVGPLASDEKRTILETRRYANASEIGNLDYDFIIPAIKSGEKSLTYDFFDKGDGEEEIVNMNQIGKFPFYMVSEFEEDDFVDSAIRQSLNLSIIILSAVMVVSTMVSYFIYKLLNPLRELITVAESMGKRDFSKKASIKSKDELGDLGRILNDASKELKEMYEEMDKKVKERTKTLEQTNRFMVGRELKMLQLKKELMEIKNQKIIANPGKPLRKRKNSDA